jgi:ABC-type branched-subunit amino acid transport system ATPase component
MNAIEVEELGKSYDGVAAVDGLSMTIGEGEIFALLGPNGAGKTRGGVRWRPSRRRSPGRRPKR